MSKIHVKTGDTVMVLNGKYEDKYNKDGTRKTGKVLAVSPKEGKLIVEGMNVATKSVKPRRQGETGGIVKAEAAMYACKVQLVCPKCGKGTRIATKLDDEGNKVRICKRCGAEIK